MKSFILTLMLAMVCSISAWAQSQKTFVKSVDLNGQTQVVASFQGDVTSSKWDNNYLRVTVTVEATNFGEEILKRLVEVGRYDIQMTSEGSAMLLTMPKIQMPVSIQGKPLVEKIRYEISVPKNVTLDIRNLQQATTVGSL